MSSNGCKWAALVCLGLCLSVGRSKSQSAEFWNEQSQETLKDAIRRAENLNRDTARNIVFFVGDGMGPSTVTAARILKGQMGGSDGEEYVMAWDTLPSFAFSKTYNTDGQIGDSAGTATAFFCGIKTNRGVVGVDASITAKNCSEEIASASVDSVMVDAQRAGKSTGFVTTSRVTDATPAALYAHSPSRSWECDADIPAEEATAGCRDIASQLITEADMTTVILGGGRQKMLPSTTPDPEHSALYGSRQDGRNLIDEWVASKNEFNSNYVWNLADFNNIDPADTDYLLGLFEYSDMQYEANRTDDIAGEPSLAEMVEKAIKILQKDEDGFFLMVEGARIDHAHHEGIAYQALHEVVAMEDAVAKARELTNDEDTLFIVTADHSHTLTIGEYPSRGNPILGEYDGATDFLDNMPYTTLQYANGPGSYLEQASYDESGLRRNLTKVDTESAQFRQSSLVPTFNEATHGGEDVAIYADGPMSHLFHGVHEQNYLAHVVRYAACIGNSTDHCEIYQPPPPLSYRAPAECSDAASSLVAGLLPYWALLIVAIPRIIL